MSWRGETRTFSDTAIFSSLPKANASGACFCSLDPTLMDMRKYVQGSRQPSVSNSHAHILITAMEGKYHEDKGESKQPEWEE